MKPSQRILDLLTGIPNSEPSEGNDAGHPEPRSYCLYRHYDQDGKLLYVGVTDDPARRLQEHLRDSRWRGKIASVSVQRCTSQQEAVAAERSAILNEYPIWNKDRYAVEREVKIPFQARLPESLHIKLTWLSGVLPGRRSIQELLLTGAARLADQLMVELAAAEKISVADLYSRMEEEMRGREYRPIEGQKTKQNKQH
jgi:predicted GIY-YIG superfamily endonuclease